MMGSMLRRAAIAGGVVMDFAGAALPTLPDGALFSRAATSGLGHVGCTFIDAAGAFQLAAANVARPLRATGGGAQLGVLVEEQRQNLALRSAWTGNTSISVPPTGGAWTFGVGTGTSASEASAYGAADNASAIRQSGAPHRPFLSHTIAMTNGVTYCISLYLEAVVSGSAQYADVLAPSVISGSLTIVQYYREGVPVASNAVAAAGRIWCVFTCTGTGNVGFRAGLGCAGNVSGEIVMSRPQCEAAAWPSSYVPTLGAFVTRPADFLTVAAATLPFVESEGTLVVGFRRSGPVSGSSLSTTHTAACLHSAGADLVALGVHLGGATSCDVEASGDVLNRTTLAAGANRIAYAWTSDGIPTGYVSVNGSAVASGDMNPPTAFTTLRLGGKRASQVLGEAISRLEAYPLSAGSGVQALSAA